MAANLLQRCRPNRNVKKKKNFSAKKKLSSRRARWLGSAVDEIVSRSEQTKTEQTTRCATLCRFEYFLCVARRRLNVSMALKRHIPRHNRRIKTLKLHVMSLHRRTSFTLRFALFHVVIAFEEKKKDLSAIAVIAFYRVLDSCAVEVHDFSAIVFAQSKCQFVECSTLAEKRGR